MIRSRCPRPQEKSESIEYHISNSQISLLLLSSAPKASKNTSNKFSRHSRPTLFTFSSNATLKEILSDKDFINLASKHSSISVITTDGDKQENDAHFELDGKILDENQQFSRFVSKESFLLVINNNIKLKFHETKRIQPNIATINIHRKDLIRRLPIENGQRVASSEQLKYPNESLDLLFDTLHGELIYLTEYLQSHFGERHQFITYPIQQQQQQTISDEKQWNEWETGLYRMHGDQDDTVNIAVVADWGAGTMESALVASAMMNGLDLTFQQQKATHNLPHYSIHLGDIYYVGLPTEIEHCCLGVKPHWADRGVRWPIGQNGSFTIPGNHELYSRGFGYWDYFLPNVENDQWRIIALDTGYDSYSLLTIDNHSIKLLPELIDWLKTVVGLNPQMTDKRGLLFFSHHQVISAWNEKPNTDFPDQIASLLSEGKTVLYLWGHEHRLSFYEKQTIEPVINSGKKLTFYGRCIGNSGFPTLATELPVKARETKLLFYDDRLFNVEGDHAWTDMALGFNGFVTMKFVRPKQSGDTSLYLTYKSLSLNENGHLTDENPTILVNEEWSVDSNGNVILNKIEPINQEITQSLHIALSGQQSPSNVSTCCTIS
ncbi:unnamed protein product [Rotaria sp. Silwood1]|nr:unnamed protein product [Rotaria sp. Silwood1]CAF1630545.1 unnamed protein product [Rotaria sp. Silwood1]